MKTKPVARHEHSHDGSGKVTDPVCGMQVDPSGTAHHREVDGVTWHFCSAKCAEKFAADPAAYLRPKAAPPQSAAAGTIWTCPMHPQIRRDGPGTCPICGMALEPLQPSLDEGPNPELVAMTRRLWVCAALAIPLLILTMGVELTGWHPLPMATSIWVQFAIATPVVLWGAWPFFERGWASLRTRNLNMFIHTGYQFDEAVGKTAHILHGRLTDEAAIKKIKAAMQAWQPAKVELISYKKNGEAFWQDLDLVPISDESGVFTHWILIGRDVSATKKAEDEIRHLAYYDALTALPNRRLLTDRLHQAMLANNRFVRHGALLYLDLDHFKNLNDTAGHAIGDMLLKQVALRLARRMREDDTVARMGGDEFVVMLKDLDGQPAEAASQAKIVAEKILADFQKPFLIDNQEFYSSPSIGITIFDDQKNPVEEILKRADLAMYQAKASGRNSLSFFESHMQENMTTRTQQEKNLRVALQKNELVLFYQPKINMNDEVVGVEALVRWQSPEKGLLPPSMFIDLAEETGLILPLGDWVLRKACEQLAVWASQPDYQHMSMSINVSVNQFNRPDFLVQVVNIIQETGTNPHKVILEITESIFAQNIEDIVRKMNALKTIGVRFALDDFGVAYSSLSHLRNLPLDEIKIDQSFVKNILHYSIDLAVAKSVIEIAKSLKIQAVAEGIETEAQRELLTAYGCYVHQGYLFAKPLPIAEFERYCLEVKKEASKRLSA